MGKEGNTKRLEKASDDTNKIMRIFLSATMYRFMIITNLLNFVNTRMLNNCQHDGGQMNCRREIDLEI